LITGDTDYVYVDVDGTTFKNGDTIWATRVQRLAVRNCVGEGTGLSWAAPNVTFANNIQSIAWDGNRGD
jgi:hypothetical protein